MNKKTVSLNIAVFSSLVSPLSHANAFLVGIAGGSAAGKSTLVNDIVFYLKAEAAPLSVCSLSVDQYYHPTYVSEKDLMTEPKGLSGMVNWDHPASFDLKLLGQQLEILKLSTQKVNAPQYDRVLKARSESTIEVGPCDIVVVEGIHAFHPDIQEVYDFKIFVQLDKEITLERRLVRDEKTRNTPRALILLVWERMVRLVYDQFVGPSRNYADLIISGGLTKTERNKIAQDILRLIIEEN